MADWIVVTDRDWFDFHRKRRREPIVFWSFANSPKTGLKSIERGERFFFLVKSPQPREIAGFGRLSAKGFATLRDLWSRYGEGLGAATLESVLTSMRQKAGGVTVSEQSNVAYYALDGVRYAATPLRPESSYVKPTGKRFRIDVFTGVEFAQSIVAGKKISTEVADHLERAVISGVTETRTVDPTGSPETPEIAEDAADQMKVGAARPFRSAREFFEREAEELGWQLQPARWQGAGWDYDAIVDGEILRIKVLEAGPGPSGRLWLSADERKRMDELRDELVVVIVTPVADGGVSFRIFAYDEEAGAWMDTEGSRLSIQEVTAFDVTIE